jgi:hypothetical protein
MTTDMNNGDMTMTIGTESKSELSYFNSADDLNRFDTEKYAKFIKGNISSILDEAYETTFKKIIETSTSLILNDVHQKMSGYIYNSSVEKQVDIEGDFDKAFKETVRQWPTNFGQSSHNRRGFWIYNNSEEGVRDDSNFFKLKNKQVHDGDLIYMTRIHTYILVHNGCITSDNFIYVLKNRIVTIKFRVNGSSSGIESVCKMHINKYNMDIPQVVIDILKLLPSKSDSGANLNLPPDGFDSFMNELDSLIKKFEQNPFYFVSGNSRFHDDIMRQKIELEQQVESFKREKEEFEAEKETILRLRQEIESSVDSEAKLEEMKKENIKRLRILKKIKQEKLQLEQERKKLEELKESMESIESLEESDIDTDE